MLLQARTVLLIGHWTFNQMWFLPTDGARQQLLHGCLTCSKNVLNGIILDSDGDKLVGSVVELGRVDAESAATNSQWVFQTSVDVTLLPASSFASLCAVVRWSVEHSSR
jgi:hypothetical protein